MEIERDTSVTDTSLPPVFQIDYLGSTELHDVYHVVVYPALVNNHEAQARYKQHVTYTIAQAKSKWHNVWVIVDLSYVTTYELLHLAYRIGLPFMREPLTIKAYGIDAIVVVDAATKSLDWLMRHTFKIEIVTNREAALPPGLRESEDEATV
jgi:hypothetical protein